MVVKQEVGFKSPAREEIWLEISASSAPLANTAILSTVLVGRRDGEGEY